MKTDPANTATGTCIEGVTGLPRVLKVVEYGYAPIRPYQDVQDGVDDEAVGTYFGSGYCINHCHAILSPLPWFSDTCRYAVIGTAVILWVILILYYLKNTGSLKNNLVVLISSGERILTRLTGDTEADIDKHEEQIREWDASVINVLKGTEYEKSWTLDVGLENPENELKPVLLARMLVIQRNYTHRRLKRLEEIRISL